MTTRHRRFNPVTPGGVEIVRLTVVQWFDEDGKAWTSVKCEDENHEIVYLMGILHRAARILEDRLDANFE